MTENDRFQFITWPLKARIGLYTLRLGYQEYLGCEMRANYMPKNNRSLVSPAVIISLSEII